MNTVRIVLLGTALTACVSQNLGTPPDAALPVADANGPRRLVLVFGQSNAGSQGLVSDLTADEQDLAAAYPRVRFASQVAENPGSTPTSTTAWFRYALGPLEPYVGVSGVPAFGVELTMARDLDAAQPSGWDVAKFSMGTTSLAYAWPPTGSFPTRDDNLFTQQVAFTKDVLVHTGDQIAALVWIQGEQDATATVQPSATDYGANLTTFVADERAALGLSDDVPFIYGRLNAKYPRAVGRDLVRRGQDANQTSTQIIVDQDPYPLRSGNVHYTTEGVLDLGHAYGRAILAATDAMR